MKIIEPAYQSVNLCFASNEKYAPHLATVLYSLLKNCDTKRMYDIIILHKDICREQQEKIKNMEKEGNVSIRFISMAQCEKKVEYDVGVYYSIETNYRLFLFGEMFAKYDKILYLDCDIIVEGYPYNVDNYRTEALGMQVPENYFNAGVLVIDLKKIRQRINQEQVFEILHRHNYKYNDQDVLNILFDGRVKVMDCRWNYMTYIPEQIAKENVNNRKLYEDLYREKPCIIHYTSAEKPWNTETKVLGDRYWKYRNEMEAVYA